MTHVIMSGPIKPLTEAEKAFAKEKHRQIRVCAPRATEEKILHVDGEVYISLKTAMELTGLAYATAWIHASTGKWRSLRVRGRSFRLAVRLADVRRGG